jgi:hypothetical protein
LNFGRRLFRSTGWLEVGAQKIIPHGDGTPIRTSWLRDNLTGSGGWGDSATERENADEKLEALHAQKAGKFAVICALVARELGFGELSAMSDEVRTQVEDEAKQYVEQWAETVEMKTNPSIRPMTPLRRLLNEYHDICERILDEQEIEVGILAHQRRTPKRRRPLASF